MISTPVSLGPDSLSQAILGLSLALLFGVVACDESQPDSDARLADAANDLADTTPTVEDAGATDAKDRSDSDHSDTDLGDAIEVGDAEDGGDTGGDAGPDCNDAGADGYGDGGDCSDNDCNGLTDGGSSCQRNTANILMQMLFDSPAEMAPANSDWYNEFATSESFQTETSISRAGPSSGRFEIKSSDPLIWGGTRAEISQPKQIARPEGWYGFSQYFPSTYVSDHTGEVVGQWHDVSDPGEAVDRSPSNALIVSDDNFKWMVRWDADRIMPDGFSDGLVYIDLGTVPKDRWIDWVVHIKYSHTNTGILEVWMDGVKVIDRQNMPNAYNDDAYPYFKLGNYKWEWGNAPKRVIYYDEVRIGTENSSYDEVKPGGY